MLCYLMASLGNPMAFNLQIPSFIVALLRVRRWVAHYAFMQLWHQPGVPIFIEHWEDNLQFYPNFALFSALGGMNLDHDFVQVSKLSEDQKKRSLPKMKHFTPSSGEDQKKRSSPKMEHFFPQN